MALPIQDSTQGRSFIRGRIAQDLIGPHKGPDEELSLTDKPTDVYVTGILYPQEPSDGEEDDDREAGGDEDVGSGQAVSMSAMRKPSSMGISFSVEGDQPAIEVSGSAGLYRPMWRRTDGTLVEHENVGAARIWKRREVLLNLVAEVLDGEARSYAGPDGLRWWVRAVREDAVWQVTVVLENPLVPAPSTRTEATFFQVNYSVCAASGSRLVPRRASGGHAADADSRSAQLIYRDVKEWAVGHTCSAGWSTESPVSSVWSDWLPLQAVPTVSADGHHIFADEAKTAFGSANAPFRAGILSACRTASDLVAHLRIVPDAYEKWLGTEAARAKQMLAQGRLTAIEYTQADAHLREADIVLKRMREGLALLTSDPAVFRAFTLAQQAMLLQAQWKARAVARQAEESGKAKSTVSKVQGDLIWRPFQLGFQLLALSGIAQPRSEDGKPAAARLAMDLLWFPTGGGKTEAYLALIAFTSFIRRLRGQAPDSGAGVVVLMRYTLRLLTIQQFERASRLILACEYIRRQQQSLGTVAFSIGLWVGDTTTPNRVADARSPGGQRARQLARCPVCADPSLIWDARPNAESFAVECSNAKCELHGDVLPVWTVDEDVYRTRPTLLLGTIDKFAQIVFNAETAAFFGGGGFRPPELIIQDELHLISGPLGTLAAIYEAAIDRLCEHEGVPAKVLGSTATIRRAEPQVRALFDRDVCQFPPAIIDATDSCFGVVDTSVPGRLYVGLTTAGRSPKFALQAACATLLQGASELPRTPESIRDPFWTLVTYFNSLRELGGALVMMYDDIPDSIDLYSRMHSSPARLLDNEFVELTSRIPSEDIPQRLAELEVDASSPNCCDIALATNMLSVGVDIPRLGLMVVNGQPKSMSEYIQATSRVGRNAVPGLILTVYNAGRPRDRSHYESFRTWHQMLYREVEATSVTPFAPRARDRALHAAIVAIVRHRIPGLLDDPRMNSAQRSAADAVVEFLGKRAARIPAEADEEQWVRTEAVAFLDEWSLRTNLAAYKDDRRVQQSLLISAEEAARNAALGRAAAPGRPTPNTMREVEPSVLVRLIT